ncbi:YitT family protein [Chitinilyticum piscinae]|uniref:YitT family protein n=1 Tax=Chitinilyticum piscinae TaxID=2866724 RepID=A0A8J7FPK7_9NEIS|nr:YitT family protein [Chitinilyticum piscinae]MBE9609854.1 YitT family protein [Chitinilyticum piscinae]
MSRRHSLFEDLQGVLTGALFMALAIQFFQHAKLLTGGVTGIAFLIHYATHWAYGAVFFIISVPFYLFAWRTLGAEFTLKTFAAIGTLSLLTGWLPHWLSFGSLNPLFAAIMGGLLAGAGILMLVRHRASLGGVTVLALYLQQRRGWRAGHVQLGFDLAILFAGIFLASPQQMLLSIAGALALNLVIAINHRPERYMGM